mgnify:CR=1 FL=1
MKEFNPLIIKKETADEIESYKSILTVLEEYKRRKPVSKPEEDYLLATLEAIREESLERVFRLLALLYDDDLIHLIHDRLIDADSDRHVRANALELLENVLEPGLARTLGALLDGNQWCDVQKKDFEEVIQEFLASQDRWLAVSAVFLIVELQLTRFYAGLKDAAGSQVSVVREAAEIALASATKKADPSFGGKTGAAGII